MRALVVGAGGVGSAIASIAARSAALEHLVLADVDPTRAARAAARAGADRVDAVRLDATSTRDVAELATALGVDIVVNACDQVVDNEWTMREHGHQAVVWQTAVHPVVALELLASGAWKGVDVLGPEALPPEPFLDRLADHGAPWAIEERDPSPA